MYLPCINDKDDDGDEKMLEHIKTPGKNLGGGGGGESPYTPPLVPRWGYEFSCTSEGKKARPFNFIQIRQSRWSGADEKPPTIKMIHFPT